MIGKRAVVFGDLILQFDGKCRSLDQFADLVAGLILGLDVVLFDVFQQGEYLVGNAGFIDEAGIALGCHGESGWYANTGVYQLAQRGAFAAYQGDV